MIKDGYGIYLEQQCCGISHNNLESNQVLCNQTVGRNDWEMPLDATLLLIAVFLSLFIPAFPLALPVYIFSLQSVTGPKIALRKTEVGTPIVCITREMDMLKSIRMMSKTMELPRMMPLR